MILTRNALHTSAALVIVLAIAASTPAVASAASEQQQGAQVLSEVKAGKLRLPTRSRGRRLCGVRSV